MFKLNFKLLKLLKPLAESRNSVFRRVLDPFPLWRGLTMEQWAVGSGKWTMNWRHWTRAEDFAFLNWKNPFIAPDKLNPILLINCNDMRKIIKFCYSYGVVRWEWIDISSRLQVLASTGRLELHNDALNYVR